MNPKNDEVQNSPPQGIGIRLDGNKLWISELTSMIFLCALLAALVAVTIVIIRNEITTHNQNLEIAALKAEQVNTTHALGVMREKHRLIVILDSVAGNRIKPETKIRLAERIYTNSKQFGYSPELLLAVIAVESRFNPAALGRYRSGTLSGALGLMQIKYPTALEVAKTIGMEGLRPVDLMDPEINMILGTAYLTMLISRFRSFKLGILAYNLGPGTVRRGLSRNEQLPTRYYERVLGHYYRFKATEVTVD
ncbi:MAG: transglycosylase SLT domain-containing protein [Chitinispirillales bacterium]|nr:transglycosylase SLT domain-containing protein [Chitinispirillales bacterium]